MQVIDNKYRKWYNNIICNAKNRTIDGYTERHHIVPRSLGGPNDTSNLVKLTAREHFICHLLLIKFTTGYDKKLMNFALGKFIQNSPLQQRSFNSWEYSKIRESISVARTGHKHSNETKKKMSEKAKGRTPWNKGVTGIIHSEESNKKRSDSLTGRKRSDEFCKKVSAGKKGHKSGMTGKVHSQETKKKMSDKVFTEEHRSRISKSKTGLAFSPQHLENLSNINKINGAKRKGIPKPKTTCPHCGKEGGNSLMTRYHFNNCKTKK